MTALLIICLIALFLFSLLMIRGNVTVEYRDALGIRLTVLGFSLWQYPKKKKPIKLSDYTPKKLEKLKKREARKAAKSKNRRKKKTQRSTSPSTAKPRSLLDNLEQIRQIFTVLLSKTAGHIRLRAERIIITVATDDAAKTAILFGAVNQAVVALVELLDQMKKWQRLKSSEIAVRADFTADKCTADISVTFSLRLWQALNILFHAAWQFVLQKKKAKQKSTDINHSNHGKDL